MVQQLPKKYIKIEEANKLLPFIEEVLWKMIKINNSLNAMTEVDIEFEDDFEELNYDIQFNKKFHELSFEFYKEYDRLLRAGCILKDLELGLVDFFSLHDGQEILLCWQLGEERIQFWHSVEEGYQDRRHVIELKKGIRVE